jgi:hypothetical protein
MTLILVMLALVWLKLTRWLPSNFLSGVFSATWLVFHSCIFWHFLGCRPGLLCEVIYWTMVLINPSYCTQEWFKWRAMFRPGVEAWSLTWKVFCRPGINKKLEVETMCRYAHALRHSPQIQDFIPVTLYISSGLDPIIIYPRCFVLDLMIISICWGGNGATICPCHCEALWAMIIYWTSNSKWCWRQHLRSAGGSCFRVVEVCRQSKSWPSPLHKVLSLPMFCFFVNFCTMAIKKRIWCEV